MKYTLPRPIIDQELIGIINREIKKQKLPIYPMSRKNLKELSEVSQEILQSGLPKHLVCKKLRPGLGRGIFLRPDAQPILKGQVIGSYAGMISIVPQNNEDEGSYAFAPIEHICLSKEEQFFLDKKNPYHHRRLYALKLDALKQGNFTRFINHSDKPNVFADVLKIPKNPYGLAPSPIEIVYIAKKTIHPGEQVLISYEDGEETYWRVCNIKPFPMTPKTFQLSSSLSLVHHLI